MLIATWIIAIGGFIAAGAAVVSACFVRKGIAEQAKIFKEQSVAYRLSLSVDMSLKLDERFNSQEFKARRIAAAKSLLRKQNEEEAEDVFDFFDSVGLFVRLNALNDEIAYSFFFHWINLYWHAGKHHIGAKQKETATVWGDFEQLYKQVCAIEKNKNPESEDLSMTDERLRNQLNDEINLV